VRRSVILAAALVLIAHAACAASSIALWGTPKYTARFTHFDYTDPAAPKGGTLKLSTNAAFDSINPYILRGLAAPGIAGYVYQPLMMQSYDEPESFYALIAQSFNLAPDRSYADVTLNPAARWSDGQPITADDIVFTVNALKEQGHPLYRAQFKPITVEKTGTRTVRFHFADRTHRELPLIVASMPVLPAHYFAKVPFDKTTLAPPVGSGPYRVSAIEAGRSITFTRDENYWGANLPSQVGMYNFDSIHYDVYRDDTVALEGIKSHQFDYYEEFIARNWATAYDIPA
jgi:microcin C transport system substrate-binding protein